VRIDQSDVYYHWLRLCTCLRRLGVPFIGTRGLGAVGSNPGRQFLPSVRWRTGQSGAPPDIHCSLSGADLLPKSAQSTIADLEPLAHRTLSGAPIRQLARPRVTRGLRGRLLARPTVGSPDSPVNFSRTLPMNSRERLVDRRQPGAPDTVRCTTGQSGVPRLRRVLAAPAKSFSFCIFSSFLLLSVSNT
jgi:hypothetical protein